MKAKPSFVPPGFYPVKPVDNKWMNRRRTVEGDADFAEMKAWLKKNRERITHDKDPY